MSKLSGLCFNDPLSHVFIASKSKFYTQDEYKIYTQDEYTTQQMNQPSSYEHTTNGYLLSNSGGTISDHGDATPQPVIPPRVKISMATNGMT
jgi:hypothetical protein